MKKWKLITLAIIIFAFIGFNYVFKDHRNINKEAPEFKLNAEDLTTEFQINPEKSETKYLNKTISVSGVISEIDKSGVTISNQVFCVFDDKAKLEIKHNQNINIKGRFIGYDDLLEIIKLDQCSIINN